ncbi:MAG TPA: hypothetical protein QF646_07045, partial [Candidatus Poseidoniales archaeon]|nr:hypothetical protein [Candidatus Poseidoniales archaeon]
PVGAFSQYEVASEALHRWLKQEEAKDFCRASISRWQIDDEVSENGLLVASHIRDLCPLCGREAFWWDTVEDQAICLASACGAWLQRRQSKGGGYDIGWPPGNRNLHVSTPEGALAKLRSWRPPEIEGLARQSFEDVVARREAAAPKKDVQELDDAQNSRFQAEGTIFSKMISTGRSEAEKTPNLTAPIGLGGAHKPPPSMPWMKKKETTDA